VLTIKLTWISGSQTLAKQGFTMVHGALLMPFRIQVQERDRMRVGIFCRGSPVNGTKNFRFRQQAWTSQEPAGM